MRWRSFFFSMAGIRRQWQDWKNCFLSCGCRRLLRVIRFGVISSVVAAYYYLRVIKAMLFDEAADPFDGRTPFARRAVLLITQLLCWPLF
ncbi:MAG: hypothetical protein R3D66_06560 [Alphaproteobacteria bacterium]